MPTPHIDIEQSRFIYLTQGRVAMVDADDYEKLRQWRWSFNDRYARRDYRVRGKRIAMKMHRFVMNAPPGMDVDHINGNKLDNRKRNLRICTRGQNVWNSGIDKTNRTGFKGVCFKPRQGKFHAQIQADGQKRHLGYFDDPETAHEAYRSAARALHREFARF